MRYLGPLSSTNGSRRFYVDISNQLDTSETLSTATVTCNDDDVTISSSSIIVSDVTTRDGTVLPADKTVTFRAACSESKNSLATITISYTTSSSNSDATSVKLKIVETII